MSGTSNNKQYTIHDPKGAKNISLSPHSLVSKRPEHQTAKKSGLYLFLFKNVVFPLIKGLAF